MELRYCILSILFTLSLGTMAQTSNPVAGKYASGEGDGYARSDVNFGVILEITPNPVCELSQTVLKATVKGEGIFTYTWKKLSSSSTYPENTTLTFPKTALSDAGKYYCLVSDGRRTVSSDTLELQVTALPIAQIIRPTAKDTIICNGDTLMLMGTGKINEAVLSWSGIKILPTLSPNIIQVAPLTETVYTLKAENQGCSTSDTIHIRINTPYVSIPSLINTSEGNMVEITARNRENEAILVTGNQLAWYKEGQKLSSVNPLQIKPSKDMEISVKYTAGGCVASAKTRLLVKGNGSFRGGYDDGFSTTCLPPVIISQHGIVAEQCVSLDSTELVVVAEGTNVRYEWQRLDRYTETFQPFTPPAGTDITGMNSGTLKFRKVSDNVNGLYRCVLTNACSTEDVISDTFNVSIKGEPVIESGINIGRDQCVASGNNVTWNIIAKASAGTGHLTYRWYKDGRQISREIDTLRNYYQFQITDPDGKEQGVYVVHVANECGTVGDTAFLPVVFPPKAASCSRNVYACTGNEAEFSVIPEHNGDYIYSLYKYDLKNDKFGDKVGSGSSRIVLPNVTLSGHYRWIITHPYCGVSSGPLESLPGKSDVMYLAIENPPKFTLQPSPTYDTTCIGSSVEYNCIAQNTTTGEAINPIRYNWYRGGVLLNATPQNEGKLTLNNIQTTQAGTYYCTAFNSCPPVKSQEVHLEVSGKPVFAGSPSSLSEYCAGESVSFRASLSDLYPTDSVRWYFKGNPLRDIPGRISGSNTLQLQIDSITEEDATGNFEVRAFNRCNFSRSNSISFKVRQPARFVRSLDDHLVRLLMCKGENQTLKVEATGTPPLRFTWLLNGDTLINNNSNILDISGAELSDKGKYSCHVQNSCGDELTAAYIQISQPDTFRLTGGGHYCTNNEGVSIYLAGSDTTDLYRLYNKTTGQLLKEIEGNSITPPFSRIEFSRLRTGTYYVTATDTNLCEYKMPGEAVITEDLPPKAFDLIVRRHICPGELNGDLQLVGSETGVEYDLYAKQGWTWALVGTYRGTGQAIDMSKQGAGDYKVTARNMLNGCSLDLPVIAHLQEQVSPALCALQFTNNDSIYCENTKSNVILTYPCYENGNSYQLLRNGNPESHALTSANLSWSGLQEGRYNLKITNIWGCSATTASRWVKTQVVPGNFRMIGTRYFCEANQEGCFLELTHSKEGIEYSFRRLSGSVLKDTISRGGPIRINLFPPEEEKFFVIATDTTSEHCQAAMSDTLQLEQSRIKVMPESPVTVYYNATHQLKIAVSDYVGDLHIQWENKRGLISEGETTLTPATVALTQSHYFPVTVTDANCSVNSGVQVNSIGGDLKVRILESDCTSAAQDTLRICGEEALALCGMASGGATGNYQYSWTDGYREIGQNSSLNEFVKETDGYIHLKVKDNQETARDSIWVIVNEAPRIDTLLENGKQCILPGSPITLTLKNSQSIARYQVEYQADGEQWQEVAILPKSGTDGQPIQFMILDGLTLEGRLRIKAAIPTRDGNGFCEKIMYGEAEVRPGVPLFEVEGSALYCIYEQPEVSIYLTGSSPGIIYRLVPSPMPAQDVTLTGDGNPLEFKGHYPAGHYHIVGESQYCRDTMNGEAIITASPLPALYDLIVKQHICPGETTGILQLAGSETAIEYDLNIKKGEGWEIVHTYTGDGQSITMPGLLAGDYKIHARNTRINCDQEFPMIVSLEEKASPSLCNLEFAGNDSVYCLNSISNIALSYPCYETGSSYQLKRNGIAEGNVITGNNLNWSNLKEGNYTLEVTNEWGCPVTTTNRRIIGQAAPEAFTLTGTQIYCTPGQTGCYLELNDSKAGIEYSFRRLSGSVLKDTISRGGTIRINVWPPEEEEFIVVATDTTPEQCQTTMQGSVRMEQSRIKVVPESPVIVNYNESTPLTLVISDYTGELRIHWDNTRHLISMGENTLTPQTVTLTESHYFPVTISDDNCDIQSGVQVNCIGGDLKISILQSDCITAISDTLRICDEDLLTLCGMASGGATGNYQYRWTDGDREIGQSNPLTGYLKTTDGYIYAEVKDNLETARDSVWIVVNETSRIDTLLENGIQCLLPGEALTLTLKNSQSAASYQVEHQTTDGEWQVVTSLIQSGNDGQPLEFMIPDALRLEGRLRIKAILPTHNGGESCEKIMYGEAEVRQAITRFETTGVASHCADEHPEINIRLSGSIPGINYRLIPTPSALTGDLQQAGNGNPLEFKGFYPDGHYRIVGESLYCRDTMNGEAIITVHPLPVIETLYESGLHCTAEGPITPGISNALVNTVYTLTYTPPTGSTSTKDYHGTGQLFFDPIEDIGTYTVSARNTITGCRYDDQRKINIEESPGDLQLEGGGYICSGETTTNVSLKIYPIQESVKYTLIRTDGGYIGAFGSVNADSMWYTGALAAGDYLVKAESGNCERIYKGRFRVIPAIQIEIPDMSRPLSTCENEPLEITLNSSIHGVIYSLYRKNETSGLPVKEHTGNGNSLRFSGLTEPGSYYIRATDPTSGCYRELYPEYHIEKLPAIFNLTGETEYCESGTGVTLALDQTEPQVKYNLQRQNGSGTWEPLPGGTLTGDGNAAQFYNTYTAGTYRVVAGTYCRQQMSGEITARAVAHPNGNLPLILAGNPCVDSTFILSATSSEAAMTYTLWFNNSMVAGSAQNGGGPLNWNITPAERGVYTVRTTFKDCSITLQDSIRTGEWTPPGQLAGDSVYCQNLMATVYLNTYEPNATYGLYKLADHGLVTQGESGNIRMYFNDLQAGDYYVKTNDGHCVATGTPWHIRSVTPPLPALWAANDCVDFDSARIELKNLEPEYDYRLTLADGRSIRFHQVSGDTTLTGQQTGIFSIIVQDTLYGCESTPVRDTIREGTYRDSVTRQTAYCSGDPGALLKLSGVHREIDYSIKTLTGTLQTIRYPERYFLPLQAGNYILEKKHTGMLGGCLEQQPFTVTTQAGSHTDLQVALSGTGLACAGQTFLVEIKGTEKERRYVLRKTGALPLDTLYGDGTNQTFNRKISEAGTYRIEVCDTILFCQAQLDTLLTLHARPNGMVAGNCSFCQDITLSNRCNIPLSGMLPGIRYRLNNGMTDVDTLTGYGKGTFTPQPAGFYQIISEDMLSGCTDTLNTEIKALPVPAVFTIDHLCEEVPSTVSVTTTGSETDKVTYSLYKNGIPTSLIPVKGTGAPVGFDLISEAGTYRIRALHEESGCGRFMDDSVVLYQARTEQDTLIVLGENFCENSTSAGATLRIPESTEGWKYYITNGLNNSDTLSGNGRQRSWQYFNGELITGGSFDLYAISPCGEDLYIASNRVQARPAPELYPLNDNHPSLCPGSNFELKLINSDPEVTYIVKRFNLATNEPEKEVRVTSTATGPLSLGFFDATGLYEIQADNGCLSEKKHILLVEQSPLPEIQRVIGKDVCLGTDGSVIELSLDKREENVYYYLYADEEKVDDLQPSQPLEQLSFHAQSKIGTYSVIATYTPGKCTRKMEGSYRLGTPPAVSNLLPVNGNLCRGETACIQLDKAEEGICYTIVNESGAIVAQADGQKEITPFIIGYVGESGTYSVKAEVSSCTATMNGSQKVEVTEPPYLSIYSDDHFCDGSAGISISVNAPTQATLDYRLYSPDRTLSDQKPGSADGGDINFKTVNTPGTYRIEAYDGITGCSAWDSVLLIRDKRPVAFDLTATNAGYICENESVSVILSGSELNTQYSLYIQGDENPVSDPISGTGKTLTFPKKIKEAGTYYVQASYENGLQCKSTFGSLQLHQAPALTAFRLIRQKSSYCVTDEALGALELENSQPGIIYQLTRDGELTGYNQTGNGTALPWSKLEGKPCSELNYPEDGYRYRIIAIDPATGCMKNMLGDDTITEVNPLVLLAQEPNDDRMIRCEGSKVQFSTTIIGCRETYTWYHDGGKIPKSNRKYYNIDSLKPQDYGEYYCEATNACGLTVSSIPVNLEVRELVKVETPLTDRAICDNKGDDIMLAAGFRNATSFRWFRTDQPEVTLSNTVYLKLTGNNASVAGTYICAANNQCNTEVQDSSVISFGFTPDIVIPDLQTDTLCIGSIYDKLRVIPGPGVIPEWYLGETPLKIKGNELILRSVETKDEGTYQVKVANACGEIIRPVGTLYVDDYMHVTDASDPTMIRCLGSSEHLFVNISPSKRVKYTWEYTDGTRVNGSSELTVGPFQEVTTQIYWVRFMNKCGMAPGEYNYREFVVHVPKPFILPTDLPREIITCASGQDTVIRLNMDPSTYANYKWWYRKNRSDVKRELLPSTTDTLGISCSTDKTGYYYCDLSNACDAKTTETIWVRIDSIPVILGSLANDTICEGGQLVLNLPATGGGLHYDWYILKEGNTIPEIITDLQEEYESIGELRLTATAAHDNCEIWCHVHNNCGEKFSNRIRLSVDKRRQVEITPADTTICAGSYAEIRITLHNGTAPWCYRYAQEENPDIQETRIAERLTDVLDISQRGNYTVTFVSDGGKCNYADGNSTFRINNYYVPEARISLIGQDSLCRGEKAQLSVSISYPPLPAGVTPSDGPWEIVFVNNRNEVMNELLGVRNPLILYRETGTNDAITYTLPPFVLPQSQTIYIGSVKDMGTKDDIPCPGIGYDSVAYVIFNRDTLQFNFRSAKDTVGICEQVRLDTLLNPNLPGSFYIDGILSSNNYLNAALAGEGKHIVKYVTQGHCPSTAEVSLWVVPGPVLSVVPADTSLCPGETAEITLSANGYGPFRLKYEIRNEKRDGTAATSMTFEKDKLPVTIKVDYSSYADSLRSITPQWLTDRFGCVATELPKAKVHLQGYPDFELWGQYPETDGDEWKLILNPYIIKEGEYVDYKIRFTEGTTPWYCEVISPTEGSKLLGPIYQNDTIYRAKAEGRYQFTAVDAFYCAKPGYNKESFVFFREEGYLRIRTMLQGPFIERDGHAFMHADLQRLGILQRERLTDCPVTGTDSIVDLIVAELRENMDSPAVAKDTFLLRNDGQLLTRAGNDTLMFTNTDRLMDADSYYIVLNHRNHLSVISSRQVAIVSEANKNRLTNYDFTITGAAYCPPGSKPENHMSQMNATCWAMAAGYNITDDGLISITNPNQTKQAPENEVQGDYYGYYWRDVNMNGIVEFPTEATPDGFIFKDEQVKLFKTKDAWILHRNRNKYSAVPPVK